jgi:WD40 repeat protein
VSADGRVGLSGCADGMVRVWELENGRRLHTLEGHGRRVWSVAVSADGRLALSGGGDGKMRLWDLESGRCLRTVEGHADSVDALAISASRHFVLAGADDGSLRAWALDWEYEFPEPADWDEGARPQLERFLRLHEGGRGAPSWSEDDFAGLLRELELSGNGWLRPDGVRAQLEQMAKRGRWRRVLGSGRR